MVIYYHFCYVIYIMICIILLFDRHAVGFVNQHHHKHVSHTLLNDGCDVTR